MSLPRTRRPAILATATLFGLTVLAAPLHEARADNVSPNGKGIVGGGLLGAEAVTMVESFAGVRPPWAYVVGGVVGAGGGAVGGYFVEQNSSDGRVPTYLLAGGLALVIPAIVLSLNATRWQPDEGATEDRVPTGPAAEPGTPGGSIVAQPPAAPPATGAPVERTAPSATPAPASPGAQPAPSTPPPTSLLDVRKQGMRVGVPVPMVRPVFSASEQRQYGMKQATELSMPLVHVLF